MKIIVEAHDQGSNMYEIKTLDGQLIVSSFALNTHPVEYEEKPEVSLNKILKLKEAGFDSDEILKMNADGML